MDRVTQVLRKMLPHASSHATRAPSRGARAGVRSCVLGVTQHVTQPYAHAHACSAISWAHAAHVGAHSLLDRRQLVLRCHTAHTCCASWTDHKQGLVLCGRQGCHPLADSTPGSCHHSDAKSLCSGRRHILSHHQSTNGRGSSAWSLCRLTTRCSPVHTSPVIASSVHLKSRSL